MLHNNKMTQVYPKSFCPCADCDKKKFSITEGFPNNRGVQTCNDPELFDCHDRYIFETEKVPENKSGYLYLNKTGMQYPPCFFQVDNNCDKGCDKKLYMSSDPRLNDTKRGFSVALDRPPLESETRLSEIYNENLTDYGAYYKNYEDINTGQISYYIDRQLEDAFYEPIYDIPSVSTNTVYKDPMGSIKPQYEKTPLTNAPNGYNSYSCLTWINDSARHREDLMSLQSRKRNEQRYAPRWT